jgi:chromate transporter
MREETGPLSVPPPSFAEAARLWARIGLTSFGGAAAQIAMLHRAVVEERGWLDERRFMSALNFCMLMPGPEAQQLATYVGWLLHGVRGGLAAGLLFVAPGALVVLALSVLYVLGQGTPLIEGVFLGVKAAVFAIITEALIRIGRRALRTRLTMLVAMVVFVAILLFDAPYPLLVIGCGIAGWLAARVGSVASVEETAATAQGSRRASLTPALACLAAWFAPVALAAIVLGSGHVLVDVGLFFARLAVLTFGGAYALLGWLAQAAVEAKGWLTTPEMIDGLGLAETTPGPTILVTQFVGFLAGFRAPEPFTPLVAGVLAALMTTWVTFAPSFLWIFAVAPHVERLTRHPRLTGALTAITACVVGVIAHLALWFALTVLFYHVRVGRAGAIRWPTVEFASLRPDALVLAAIAGVLIFRFRRGVVETVAVMAGLGAAWGLAPL